MNIYEARYRNALKHAAKINRYLKKGYHVFHNGYPTKNGFILKDNELLLKDGNDCFVIYFLNNSKWDNGYYTKISEWNKEFKENFTVYEPGAKVNL